MFSEANFASNNFVFHDVTVPGGKMYDSETWEEERKANPDLPTFDEMFEAWFRGTHKWNWRFIPTNLLTDPYKVNDFLAVRHWGDEADPV